MNTQPSQYATLGQQIPEPAFASVRVEFADGTFREFHVHKPLRTEIDISSPFDHRHLTADLGVIPPGIIAPTLPEVSIRMKAGLSPHHQVITMDSRTADPAGTTGQLLRLLSEAYDLREMCGGDGDLWREWERKTRALLEGGQL